MFEGVATRAEFWYFWLFTVIVAVGFSLLIGLFNLIALAVASGGGYEAAFGLFSFGTFLAGVAYVVYLGLIIPHIALLVRRFRDTGRAFWYYFLILVPVFGFITILVMCAQPSKGAATEAPASA